MKAFIQFVIKEFYHITRDYRTLAVLFGMPLIQLILFGYAIRTELNNADIGILDHSKDEITKKLSEKILSSGYFSLKADLRSNDEIESAFKSGKVNEVIIFEPGFSKRLYREGKASIQILTDASNPNAASMLNSYTSAIIADFNNSLNPDNNSMLRIKTEQKMLYNPELKSVYMFIPGIITLILMLVCALITSIAITKEKEMGNMEVLLVSPLKPITIIIGKVLPYVIIALLLATMIITTSLLVFQVPFNGSLILLFFEGLLFVTTALSLGILISTIANSMAVAMMLSLAGLLMPTVLLSGFIFPVENMPFILQLVSNIIPARWFLIIIKAIMLKGLGIEYLWKETLILVGMTIVLIFISMKKFKIRLE